MDIGAENSVSLGGNIWQVARADGRVTEVMAQKFDLPLLIAEIMSLRGVDVDDAPSFLEPKINRLMPDPFVLKDMKRAACRIAEAVMKKEQIAIIGDYDVDGATSTSVMKLFLQSVGVEPQIHIPDQEEGYGPSIKAVDDFKAAGARLLLTLDCGTTAFDSLEYAASLGIIMKLKSDCPKFMPWLIQSDWMKMMIIRILNIWRRSAWCLWRWWRLIASCVQKIFILPKILNLI